MRFRQLPPANEEWLDFAGKATVYNYLTIAGNSGNARRSRNGLIFLRPKRKEQKMLQAMEYILLILLVIIAWCMIYNKLMTPGKEEEDL